MLIIALFVFSETNSKYFNVNELYVYMYNDT